MLCFLFIGTKYSRRSTDLLAHVLMLPHGCRDWELDHVLWDLGDFRVAFCLCFKASPSAKPFIWKLVLFTRKFWFIYMWIKLISIWKASHKDSPWNRGERQLGNRLLCDYDCYAYLNNHRDSTFVENSVHDVFLFVLAFYSPFLWKKCTDRKTWLQIQWKPVLFAPFERSMFGENWSDGLYSHVLSCCLRCNES